MRLRNVFAASRFVIGLAVLGSFVGSAILLVIATITLFRIAWNEIVNFDPDNLGGRHIDRLGVELIEIIDIILLGTVLYIVALGLYQLFIDQPRIPATHGYLSSDLGVRGSSITLCPEDLPDLENQIRESLFPHQLDVAIRPEWHHHFSGHPPRAGAHHHHLSLIHI